MENTAYSLSTFRTLSYFYFLSLPQTPGHEFRYERAIIIGATSGIGREVAKQLLLQGWRLGIAGRRLPALEALQSSAPDLIEIAVLDVTQPDATPKLNNLIRRVGGMDLFLLSSGIGYQNMELNRTSNWIPPYQCRRIHADGRYRFPPLP